MLLRMCILLCICEDPIELSGIQLIPNQGRGEEIICLSVTLPVNIRSRETEIAIIT